MGKVRLFSQRLIVMEWTLEDGRRGEPLCDRLPALMPGGMPSG
ncbi:MAG: hypothetical protein ACLSBB_14995 [Ruthenibacterium lactatiformans]